MVSLAEFGTEAGKTLSHAGEGLRYCKADDLAAVSGHLLNVQNACQELLAEINFRQNSSLPVSEHHAACDERINRLGVLPSVQPSQEDPLLPRLQRHGTS